MILKKTIDGYNLIDQTSLIVLASSPWKLNLIGLIRRNCDLLFKDLDQNEIEVDIENKKYVGTKYCLKLKNTIY